MTISIVTENIQKKTILFLGTQIARAGAQNVLLNQAAWFDKQGYSVTVVFFYDKQDLLEEWRKKYTFPILNLNAWRAIGSQSGNVFRLLVGISKLYKLMKQEKFDVVETFTPHSNIIGLPIAFFARIPLRIGTHHGKIENAPRWIPRLHGIIINSKFVSKLVVVSSQVRNMAIEDERINSGKVQVIHNGIIIPKLLSNISEIRQQLRSELEIDNNANIVITLGRIVIQKGHRYLVEAIPIVLEKHPNTVFAIAGEGELLQEVKAKADDLGINEHLKFLGNRENVKDLLIGADVFVLSSLWEGLPIAMLEAMVYETPIVVTKVEGILDIIEHNKHGITAEPKDKLALANGIIYMLDNPREAELMGKKARKLVSSEHSVDIMCGKYEKLFLG